MTALGIVIAATGLILLLAPWRWLYGAFLISIPFSGTSVLNVGSGETASGVQVWMYFGALLLIRSVGNWLLRPDRRMPVELFGRSALLLLFVIVLVTSLLMPIYIDGRLQITSPTLTDFSSSPLHLTARNFTSVLYVIFGCLVALCVAHNNVSDDDARFTERCYIAAAIITCGLALSEFLAHLLKLPSPTLLFRNSASHGAEGYLAELSDNFTRVSSVAVEPSILSQYLVSALPLTLSSILGTDYVYSKRTDWIFCLLIVAVLLLTTSSVAFLTLLAAPLLTLPILLRIGSPLRRILRKLFAGGLIVTIVFGGLYLLVPIVRQLLDLVLFTKAGSYSSLERLKTISLAWSYFLDYPLLGVGWGSVTCHDTIVMILSNSGLLGLGAFCYVVTRIGKSVFHGIRDPNDPVDVSRARWLLAGMFLLFASAINEFPFVFGHLWLIIGMGIAASLQNYRRTVAASPVPAHVSGRTDEGLDGERFLPA